MARLKDGSVLMRAGGDQEIATKKDLSDKVKTDVPINALFTDTNTTYTKATTSSDGLLSKEDKVKLNNSPVIDRTPITVNASGWVDNTAVTGWYYYQFTNSSVTTDTVVDIYFALPDEDTKNALLELEIARVESYNGYYRIYTKNLALRNFTIDSIRKSY